MTFVQVIVFIVTTALYGIGPIGIGYKTVTGDVSDHVRFYNINQYNVDVG